jgi:hypothetical protein
MLRITLDTLEQSNTFQLNETSSPHFEIEVVNEGLFPEVKLFYLANKKRKSSKKSSQQKFKQAINLKLTA